MSKRKKVKRRGKGEPGDSSDIVMDERPLGKKKKRRGMRKKRFERLVFSSIMIALVVVIISAPALFLQSEIGSLDDPTKPGTALFYEGACTACDDFVTNSYKPWLKDNEVPALKLKNMDSPSKRRFAKERLAYRNEYKVPKVFQKPIEIYVVSDITVIFIGDAPKDIVDSLLSPENITRISNSTDRILFYQDVYLLPSQQTSYTLWGFKGPDREYDLGTPISAYLDEFEAGLKDEPVPDRLKVLVGGSDNEIDPWFPIFVAGTALADGINPCAIAILIFFITFLYSSKNRRAKVMMMGTTYIMAIYTIYFLIGLGLFGALATLESGFIITGIGAAVMIILGLISMRDYLFPRLPVSLEVPYFLRKHITRLILGATLPTTLMIGLLIGAYTFPCSGAVYVVIISMLAERVNFTVGLFYLLWYNLWFIMPLLIILVVAANKRLAQRMREWEYKTSRKIRAASGLVMVALGVFVIVWYIITKIL